MFVARAAPPLLILQSEPHQLQAFYRLIPLQSLGAASPGFFSITIAAIILRVALPGGITNLRSLWGEPRPHRLRHADVHSGRFRHARTAPRD